MKLLRLFIALIIFVAFTSTSDFLTLLQARLNDHNQTHQQEKIYVHTDKLQYTSGDTIWLKTYLIAASSHQSAASRVVYLTLKNSQDSLVAKRKLYVEQGGAAADIPLPTSLSTGNYQLAAYTNHQLNTATEYIFKKTISVFYQTAETKRSATSIPLPDANNNAPTIDIRPVVQFFPEGGDLVNDIASVVGWKIVDATTGQELSASGYVEDNDGNIVTVLKTYQFGMGRFTIRPKAGKKYQAVITVGDTEQVYPLPTSQAVGEVLQVNSSEQQISIKGVSNRLEGFQDYSLVIHTRGTYISGHAITVPNKVMQFNLPKQDLPAGLLAITLFDQQQRPVAERLVFVAPSYKQPLLHLSKSTFSKREQVSLKLDWQPETKPLWNSNSLAVVNQNAQLLTSPTDNILSWFLLNSDLGGELKNAAYYFTEVTDKKRAQLLNLVLLTHGWRRFSWKDILVSPTPVEPEFAIETGLFLDGKTTYELRNKKPVSANVFISFLPSMLTEQLVSAPDGTFSYGPFAAEDTISVVVQARLDNKRSLQKKAAGKVEMLDGKSNVNISLSPRLNFPQPKLTPNQTARFNTPQPELQAYLTTAQRAKVADRNYETRIIDLVGAEVTANRLPSTPLEKIDAKNPTPSSRVVLDSFGMPVTALSSVFDLLYGIGGVTVNGGFPNQGVIMRGLSTVSGPPLYLLDGTPIPEENVVDIPVTTVYNVDVYRGVNATFFGRQASNGVIAIYTRAIIGAKAINTQRAGIANITFPAFYRAREFYQLKHNEQLKNPKPDFRTTLHWDAHVELQTDSTVVINFYTGDAPADYQVILEGIDSDGRIYRAVEGFIVE